MSESGLRQKAAVAVLAVVVLYAIAAGTWFMSAKSSWKRAAQRYRSEQAKLRNRRALIASRSALTDRYEAAKAAMPVFDAEQSTDTTWRQYIGDLASSNLVSVTRLNSGEEISGGEVTRLPVTIDWQGSLEGLVRYLYAIETSKRGMMDVQELTVEPIEAKPGYLKGTMTVNCAYMRAP